MRVLMVARPDLYSVPGGDTIQISETAKALKELGVNADIIITREVDYSNYNLIHFFNIIDPEDILGHVYKSKLPYVVSSIYVDYSEYDKLHRKDALGKLSRILPRDTVEYIKTMAKYVLKQGSVSTPRFFLKGHRGSIRFILRHAKLVLPNSENEYRRLEKDYGVTQKYMVVPNAVNTNLFRSTGKVERDIVLCVGRIEGRKNQLNVIRALKDTPYKVVFIGPPSPNQGNYVKQCKEEASGNMQFIEQIPQEQLLDYYKRARVHVLASWFETTGLSNLEAGAMGCQLVLGNRGDVKDYFGELAFYCEPGDCQSIQDAVNKAWNAEKTDVLPTYIFNNFTWKRAAEVTLKAYKDALQL